MRSIAGSVVRSHSLPEFTTDILFVFQDPVEVLNDPHQLIEISCFQCGIAQCSPVLVFSSSDRVFHLVVWHK